MLRYPPPPWYEGPFFVAAVILVIVLVASFAIGAIVIWRKRRARAK